ncbi:signal peptidase I [Candidatus Saccharibacteria bacterium]|nr:signal peptidase I [Candidatus Saccharibacteria bacterium]
MNDDAPINPYATPNMPQKTTNHGGIPKKTIKPDRSDGLKSILSTIAILLMAPILALMITAYVFQSYEVDGPSMETTLQDKDRLIVWKMGHTLSKISKKPYIPDRGAIIVFTKKGMYDFSGGKEKQLIKRVIALPGERVSIHDGAVTVFNDQNPEGFNPDITLGIKSQLSGPTEGEFYEEVEEGEVYVMGDHRNNSLDSRAFGPIPSEDIVGTLSARILPLSAINKF